MVECFVQLEIRQFPDYLSISQEMSVRIIRPCLNFSEFSGLMETPNRQEHSLLPCILHLTEPLVMMDAISILWRLFA